MLKQAAVMAITLAAAGVIYGFIKGLLVEAAPLWDLERTLVMGVVGAGVGIFQARRQGRQESAA